MLRVRCESQVSKNSEGHLQIEDTFDSLSLMPRSVMITSFQWPLLNGMVLWLGYGIGNS